MSPVCHSFVQNAWKKDFCSNCFKSREEHVESKNVTDGVKYHVTNTLQTRGAFFKKSPPSILKVHPKKKIKRSVRFHEKVSSVIGYGGDDWSDGEEFEVSEDNDEDDTFPDTEEEREMHRITKANTDFNTVKSNLIGDSGKSYTSLMLGKVQTDSDGKKKTLMVSVTPFGHDTKSQNPKAPVRKPAAVNLSNGQSEESTNTYKTNIVVMSSTKETETVVCTSTETKAESTTCAEKTLLEEISETLEQNRINRGDDLNFNHNNVSKPTVIEEKVKDNINNVEEDKDKKDSLEIKKSTIVRNPPITRNHERPKVNISTRPEFKFCKINIDNSSVDSAVDGLNSANNSLASDDESFSGRLDSDNDDSGHFSEPNKCEETVKIKVYNDSEKNIKFNALNPIDGKANGYSTFQTPIVDMPAIIPKQPEELFSVEASREMAGEPDGRADPDDLTEAPALPNTPVPSMDPRPSFLHGMISDVVPSAKPAIPEKPKLPVKTLAALKQNSKKNVHVSNNQVVMQLQQTITRKEETSSVREIILTEEKNNEITEVHEYKADPVYYAKPVLTKQDSDTSLHSIGKRQAPTPPVTTPVEEFTNNIYQRNPNFIKSDSPVVREMEKRERATTNVPKPKSIDETDCKRSIESIPEPAPRKNISLSHDNLLIEEKRKGKLKFSIKKLLRIGSSKDLDKKDLSVATVSKMSPKTEELYDFVPKPKPRLVIIHPLDVNGSNVEVVKTNGEMAEIRRLSHDDASSIYSGSSTTTDLEVPVHKVVNKPPPPPRHSSELRTSSSSPAKPTRPPPPKSIALQKKQKQQAWAAPSKPDTTIYANLGEIRSTLAPRKPERTASMREREAHLELPKRRAPLDDKDDLEDSPELVQATNEPVIHNYDDVYNSAKYVEETSDSKHSDSDYEYVHHARSSSPECDAAIKCQGEIKARKPDDYPKYSRSSNYCGSETESEIYSPYSFYSSTDAMDGPSGEEYQHDLTPRTSKLRVRKGRSVVHKNLEDNYGAVVIANHEALAQVLEQVQQSAAMQPSLRGLKASTNLRWSDFTVAPACKSGLTRAGRRVFCPALWAAPQGGVSVTLMMYREQMASQLVGQCQPSTLSLNAVTEFCDLVPRQLFGEDGEDLVQATIVVLPPAQVDTIQTYSEALHSTDPTTTKDNQLLHSDQDHEAVFMMLQLINGLKSLQARGVEEFSLSAFVCVREAATGAADERPTTLSAPKTNCYGRLCILQGWYGELYKPLKGKKKQGLSDDINSSQSEADLSSLCSCALRGAAALLPGGAGLGARLAAVLGGERAGSLSQAKAVLEFTLWGPLDVVQATPPAERELSLQRWLDLERATVLHGLVRSRVQLNVFEQLHLMFLVRSTAKNMCEASALLETARVH